MTGCAWLAYRQAFRFGNQRLLHIYNMTEELSVLVGGVFSLKLKP